MIYKQNLHTHSVFCDGKDTPEETVITAIEKGYDSIGFSGHSSMYYSPKNGMSPDGTESYKDCIASLKEKYRDKIDIFCGIEYDMYSNIDLSGYDYRIGGVHYLKIGSEMVGMDRSQQVVQDIINEHFGGDGMAYARHFYGTVAQLPQYGKFDIVAHFDLLCKHSENVRFFDEDSKEYRDCALQAMSALRGRIPFFEVNTGAIARGYRTTPYPAPFLIREFKNMGFGALITSDCHDRQKLDCFYSESLELLRANGYNEIYILTKDGFRAEKIR